MEPRDDLDWELAARYFAGHATRAERDTVERWAAAAPGRAEELAALRAWWETAAGLPPAPRVDAMWRSLQRRMHDADGAPSSGTRHTPAHSARVLHLVPREPARPAWRRAVGVAAAALVCVTGGALAWRTLHTAPPTTRTASATPRANDLREFATGRGQRATVRLVDGTRVELGYASRLRVRAFDGARREMWLEGEAVFDVVHDAKQPFLVHAAHAVTEDIGTVFGVRAYPGDEAVRVLVVSGKVAVKPQVPNTTDTASTLLTRGMVARLHATGRVDVAAHADTAASLDWMAGRVAFHDVRLDEIAAELGRRFDVDVRVRDERDAARRVTVDMPMRSLNEVLDAVVAPLSLAHRRAGDVILLGK